MESLSVTTERARHRRRLLAAAVAIGFAIGLAFAGFDAFADLRLLSQASGQPAPRLPAEMLVRGMAVVLSVAGSVAYGRLLLAKQESLAAGQRYRALAESARDDIFIVDSDGRIAYMNTFAAGEFGETPEALVGRPVSELFKTEESGRAADELQRAFSGVETYSEMEFTFRGQTKWLSTRLVPLSEPGGGIGSVLGISRDITAARRAITLSEASNRISNLVHAKLSVDEILRAVTKEVTHAAGADAGMVLMRQDDGWTVRSIEGGDEDSVGMTFSAQQFGASEAAAQTQAPVVIDDTTRDPRVDPHTIERFGIHSLLVVPLITRHEVIGVLFLGRMQLAGFTPDVVEFVSRVATSITLAMENARLYEQQRDVADSLQSAILLMPETMPGLEFAHAYHSSTEAARVGGDFYDLFELRGGRVGITIGDISGHGVDAAVLTSLVKDCVRVEATQEDRPPDEVMATTNEVLLQNSPPEIFATVFFGELDLATGRLLYCNAGHTTGYLCGSGDGAMRGLAATSPLVGALPARTFTLSEEHLSEDDLLFLYTDGLTEARRGGEFFGEARLTEVLSARDHTPPADVVRAVVHDVVEFTGNRLSDDLAILAVERGQPEGETTCEVPVGRD